MDVLSIVIGFACGSGLGYMLGAALKMDALDKVSEENDALRESLNRLTDRDSKGRFVKREGK